MARSFPWYRRKGLAAKRDKELEEKLENYRKSLSDEELTRMVENTKALEAYQESEEDPETLTCIPMLSREDIKKEITGLTNEEHHVRTACFCIMMCAPMVSVMQIFFLRSMTLMLTQSIIWDF